MEKRDFREHTSFSRSCHPASTITRNEKAIAALTLAMANGAAGISDYEALRLQEGLTTLDATHAGELWD